MAKKLNPSVLKKEDKQYSQTKRVDLGEYYIDIDVKFRPTKVKAMIADIQDRLIQLGELGFDTDNISMFDFVMFYVIKHFSNLPIPNDFSDELKVFEYLIDSQYYAPICEAFDKEELENVFKRINDVFDTLELLREKQETLRQQFVEANLQNADILL